MSHHPERTARNVRPVNQPPSINNDRAVSMKWKLRPTIEAKARPRLSIWARLGRLVQWG